MNNGLIYARNLSKEAIRGYYKKYWVEDPVILYCLLTFYKNGSSISKMTASYIEPREEDININVFP